MFNVWNEDLIFDWSDDDDDVKISVKIISDNFNLSSLLKWKEIFLLWFSMDS
jgi:hypothetical protein